MGFWGARDVPVKNFQMKHKKHYSENAPYTGCNKTSLLIAKYWQMIDERIEKDNIRNNEILYEAIIHHCYNRIIKIALRLDVSKLEFDHSYSGLLA